MSFLTRKDRKRIADAVQAAERRTRAEFVTVIARAADDYTAPAVLCAALLALLLPGPFLLLDIGDPHWLYIAQMLAFIVAASLMLTTPLRYRLVPGMLKRRRARRLAREQFMAQGVSRTRERSGVLLFVSVAEHYVEILADTGISDKVDPQEWQAIVDGFINHVQAGRVADGFVAAIEDVTTLLEKHFPGRKDDANELPNRLVEI